MATVILDYIILAKLSRQYQVHYQSWEVKETKFFLNFGSYTQYGQHGMYSFYVSVNCGLVDTHIVRLTACCTMAKSSLLVSSFFLYRNEKDSQMLTLL